MGSPLGPTLVNLFLIYYKDRWLDNCSFEFQPRHYRAYVDDVLLMFERKNQVKKFLKYMNTRKKKNKKKKSSCEE